MNKKGFLKIVVTCVLLLVVSACTTHRRPNEAPVVDANAMNGGAYGAGGSETYTQGAGREGGAGYVENSKCCAARPVPLVEQHYFFDFDSSDVRQDALPSIRVQANYLVKHPNVRIRLEGNTDDVGSREYNIALGERRARAVLDVLKQYGVASSQVTLVSFGAEKPAAGGEDEQARQCNRRVDLKY